MDNKIKKFLATNYGRPRIEVVFIDKESGSSVWVGDSCMRKSNNNEKYADTEQEARDFLVGQARVKLNKALAQADYAQDCMDMAAKVVVSDAT